MAWRVHILHNLWLKLFSVILAVLIWMTIRLAIQKEIRNLPANSPDAITNVFPGIPVSLLTSPSERRVFSCQPPVVSVMVAADAKLMRHLRPQDLEVFVRLTDMRQASQFQKKLQYNFPPAVTLIRINPATVTIQEETNLSGSLKTPP